MKKLILAILVVVSAGTLSAQTTLAHVNAQAVLDTLPSRKAAVKKLQEFEYAGMLELQEMELDFNNGVAKYQNDLPGMSPVIQKIEEEKLMKKQQSFQERQQSFQVELQEYANELNVPVLKIVQDAVKSISEKKKIDIVVDQSVTLYFVKGTDITDEVMAEALKMDQQ